MKIWIGCTAPIEEALIELQKAGVIDKQTRKSMKGMLGTDQEHAVTNFFLNFGSPKIDGNPCIWCGVHHKTYDVPTVSKK